MLVQRRAKARGKLRANRIGVRLLSVLMVGTGEGFILVNMAVTVLTLLFSLEKSPLYHSAATVNTRDFMPERASWPREPVVLES